MTTTYECSICKKRGQVNYIHKIRSPRPVPALVQAYEKIRIWYRSNKHKKDCPGGSYTPRVYRNPDGFTLVDGRLTRNPR